MLVFSFFSVDFNGTVRIRASPSFWVWSWSHAWHVNICVMKGEIKDVPPAPAVTHETASPVIENVLQAPSRLALH